MKPSLTYYITLLVLKIKGLKKDFSKDPIDFKKIRKGDVFQPKGKFFKQHLKGTFKILDTTISEIKLNENSENLIIFIHGGAFISGPSEHHWATAKELVQGTNQSLWMCNYPKAPQNKILAISENIDLVYQKALESYEPNQISIIGDSAGATLITCLIQRLVKSSPKLPAKIILVSPVMDASMTNIQIEEVDKKDPMLSKVGVRSAKKMCAGSIDLRNEMISPLYGSFENFPPTAMFIAENDITYPDQKLAILKMIQAKTNLTVIEGMKMPHIWSFLPVMKEAKSALKQIIDILKK